MGKKKKKDWGEKKGRKKKEERKGERKMYMYLNKVYKMGRGKGKRKQKREMGNAYGYENK